MRKIALSIVSLLLLSLPLIGQEESFDDLFNNAEDVIVEEKENAPTTDAEEKKDISVNEALKTIKFSGKLTSEMGTEIELAPKQELSKIGFTINNDISFASRISDIFSVKGNFNTKIDEKTTSLDFKMNSFYFTYLLFDKFFLQAGMKSINWSIARTDLKTGTNLLSGSEEGLSLKANYYFRASDIELIVLNNSAWNGDKIGDPKSFSFATKLSLVLGPVNTNIFTRTWAVNDENAEKPVAGLEIKTTFFKFDIYEHTHVHFDIDCANLKNSTWRPVGATFLLGTYRLWDEPRIGINAEYKLDWTAKTSIKHSFALNFGWSRLFNSTSRIALKFIHTLSENALPGTGSITPVYEFCSIPDATITAGIPISYGKDLKDVSVKFQLGFRFNFSY